MAAFKNREEDLYDSPRKVKSRRMTSEEYIGAGVTTIMKYCRHRDKEVTFEKMEIFKTGKGMPSDKRLTCLNQDFDKCHHECEYFTKYKGGRDWDGIEMDRN